MGRELQLRLTALEARQASRALPLDERPQGLPDERALLGRARQALRLRDQVVVESESREHIGLQAGAELLLVT